MKQKLIELLQKWLAPIPVIEVKAGDKVTLIFTYPDEMEMDRVDGVWSLLQDNMPDCVVLMVPEGVKLHKAILRKNNP